MTFTDWLILNQINGDLVKAIESLRTTPDYVKEYIFPVAIAFASAFLGGLSAVYINKRQELQKIAKDNLVASIQAMALAQDCLNNLISIKANYLKISSDEPLIRASEFTTIITKFDHVTFNINSLFFIRQIPTANKKLIESLVWKIKHSILWMKIKMPPSEELRGTWRNSVRISVMFKNYNEVMELLRYRNELNELVKDKLSIHDDELTLEQVQIILGKNLCGGFIDITESSIALIDHVMSEFYHFLLEFPAIAKSNIELSRVKEWGGIPTYENKQEAFLNCMKPIKPPDYKKFFAYTGLSEQDSRDKYIYKSWSD